ncbi:hypothetical protein LWF15_33475 [Kineosporia rhizophila]|uniref:ParB family protein n=1 Tax=Kineosporia rhizophila TaxID=84633 RepID=UPI000B00A65B|nr:hypothetical protein [Kineosporia rhizophila]MCE0540416.1 hypothetical protein [Kineosporia rhizophila]
MTKPAANRSAAAEGPKKGKVGFYQDPQDSARARAAYKWCNASLGYKSFSDFIAAAVMKEVERLEKEYHGGEPWEDVAVGEIPAGRPVGT